MCIKDECSGDAVHYSTEETVAPSSKIASHSDGIQLYGKHAHAQKYSLRIKSVAGGLERDNYTRKTTCSVKHDKTHITENVQCLAWSDCT